MTSPVIEKSPVTAQPASSPTVEMIDVSESDHGSPRDALPALDPPAVKPSTDQPSTPARKTRASARLASPAAASPRVPSPPPPKRAKTAKSKDPEKDRRSIVFLPEAPISKPPTITALNKQLCTATEANASQQAEIIALRAELDALKRMVSQHRPAQHLADVQARITNPTALPAQANTPAPPALPNAHGELPPPPRATLHRTCSPWNYYPAGVHSLAAARVFKHLSPTSGPSKYSSPTALLLALREMGSVRFEAIAPICVALYSCRLGSRGASILMFCEKSELDVLRSGSSNANYNVDVGASTPLPPHPPCGSYKDLLDGIHGLSMMANDLGYYHARKILGRLRAFVSKNKAADPSGTPARIQLTHQYVDRFLGRAMGCLQSEASTWWNEYCDALGAIDYNTHDWSLALLTAMHSAITNGHDRHPRHTAPPNPKRPSSIPEDIRRLIPRENGVEPCL